MPKDNVSIYILLIDLLIILVNNTCEREFHKITKELCSKTKYKIHSLRHTFITRCQEANIPLHIIQRWVGHNIGSEVTTRVYTHTRELAELENIKRLNDSIEKI